MGGWGGGGGSTEVILVVVVFSLERRERDVVRQGGGPSTKTECDYLDGWIKNGHIICKNLTQNGEPRDIGGERRRRRRMVTGKGVGWG